MDEARWPEPVPTGGRTRFLAGGAPAPDREAQGFGDSSCVPVPTRREKRGRGEKGTEQIRAVIEDCPADYKESPPGRC